jgi:hypothetical protein
MCALSTVRLATVFLLSMSVTMRSAPHSTPQTRPSASTVEEEIVTAVRARANAFASGDCQTYATFIATDFRDIEGAHIATRKEILEECQQEARPLSGHKIERLVSDFHVQLVDNIALIDYLYEFREHYGEVVLSLTSRNVDTCENRQGKWVALLAVSAAIIRDPPVAKIDSARLADFVGTYAWVGAPNLETVFRKGDRLYIQGTWEDSPTELLPEKQDTFFVRGEGAGPQSRVAFLRDEGGRVIGERVYSPADGQGYNTRRIK